MKASHLVIFSVLSAGFVCGVVPAAGIKKEPASLSPVVFLPGFAGCELFATVASEEFLPPECVDAGVVYGEKFLLAYNLTMDIKYSACASALLEMQFDKTAQPMFFDRPGVTISTADHDGIAGLAPVYWKFFSVLKEWGYTVGKNLFTGNYDYRYSSNETLRAKGIIDSLQNLVEKSYDLSMGQQVYLIGHSNGGPTMYTFLQEMTPLWKEKHIAGMISLSGNFLGQMNCIKPFVYADVKTFQDLQATWEASYSSFSFGGYEGLDTIKAVVTTYSDTDEERSYSAQVGDIQALFDSAGRADWSEKMGAVYPSMDRRPAPKNVNVYCLYGSNVSTTYSFTFSGPILTEEPERIDEMDGDGNQDAVDNTFCLIWQEPIEQAAKIGGREHSFYAEAFPGVSHMDMISDTAVLERLHEILFASTV